MILKFSEIAAKDLKAFDPPERHLIAKKLEYLTENYEELQISKKITELKGTEYRGVYRFVIAKKIRAIFRVEKDKIVLLILRIGKRKEIY